MDIISLLTQSLSDMAIVHENIRATQAMEADIIAAIEQRTAKEPCSRETSQ